MIALAIVVASIAISLAVITVASLRYARQLDERERPVAVDSRVRTAEALEAEAIKQSANGMCGAAAMTLAEARRLRQSVKA